VSGGAIADEEAACLLALASLPGIGPATVLACHRDPGAVLAWTALRKGTAGSVEALAIAAGRVGHPGGLAQLQSSARTLDPGAVLDDHRRFGVQVLVHGRDGYPRRLLNDPAPPAVLVARGDMGVLDGPTVAIVGTRRATRVGCDTAGAIADQLAERGVAVVSGLALGIDGAAHRSVLARRDGGSIRGTGRPVGVVAAGPDRAYPRRHHDLHDQVAHRGVLLGETPLGGDPLPWRFPARNRIIAGLADAVVVVESRSAGGSMITAAEALARDVPVLAVPGHPSSPASAGSLDLICDGAMPARDVDDILVAIGLGGASPSPARPPGRRTDISVAARHALDALQVVARTLSGVVDATGLALEDVAPALLELEARGEIVRTGAWYERVGVVHADGSADRTVS